MLENGQIPLLVTGEGSRRIQVGDGIRGPGGNGRGWGGGGVG